MLSEQKCSKCGEVKLASFFHRRHDRPSGLVSVCKQCRKEYNRKRNQTLSYNRASSPKACLGCGLVKAADQFHSCKTRKDGLQGYCVDCGYALRVRRNYGVDHGRYNAMRKTQDYRCKICGIHETDAGHGRLCVDHHHGTGAVRGLLCNKCNSAIGLLGDNCATLRSALKYLEESK